MEIELSARWYPLSYRLDTVGESKNVRQTSVCRGFRQRTSGGNQRQTEVCRTFPAPFRPNLEFANSIRLVGRTLTASSHQTCLRDSIVLERKIPSVGEHCVLSSNQF